MSIRAKFVVACLCCALIPLIGYAAYTYARTVQHLERLENAQLAAREVAVDQALEDAVSEELANVTDTATWPAFAAAAKRSDVSWLRQQLAALPAVTAGGSAQLFTPEGELLLSAGPSGAGSLWLGPEVQKVIGIDAPAAGYETLDGRLSIVAAQNVQMGADSGEPFAVLAVLRLVDDEILATIGSYAGVRVKAAPAAIAEEFKSAAESVQAGSGVLNQFGSTFTDGDYRGAYLGVYDTDGYRSGLVMLSMERSAVTQAVSEIRTMAIAALVVALAVAAIAALLVSRRISRPLQELAAAAVGIAEGETTQDIHVSGSDEVGQLAGAFNTMSERVTARVTDLSEKIRDLTEELTELDVDFGETLTDTVDVEAELPHMISRVGSMMKADLACLYLTDEAGGQRLASGDAGSHATRLEAAARQAVSAGATVVIEAGEGEADAGEDLAGVSLAAAPLKRAGKVTGALVVLGRERRFDAQDLALLFALAGQVALATHNADTFKRLESSYLSTVTALASAIEAKDEYTADHCRLIAGMAEAVGAEMGRSESQLRLLRYAAILHDIGKTGVPESILRTPGRLSEEQFVVVAEHTVMGEGILSRIDYLHPIAPVIRSAHERWDGNGYPDRLRGEDIPLTARIVFACDAYHAMISDRPYRKALTPEAALAELLDASGTQFDPQVVEAFVAARAAIERLFMKGTRAAQQVDRVLATVLVTDIVGSTVKAAEMGDSAWRELRDQHHAKVRALLRRYRGNEIDTAGDGFLATFDGAARAVECAAAIGRELEPLGLEIRAGCHTGEIELTGAHAGGIAVHIGARVAALAGPGEVLVSGTVRDLVAGSGLAFVDRGEHELKGVPGVWRLYAVKV